jgi:hypothetical protein
MNPTSSLTHLLVILQRHYEMLGPTIKFIKCLFNHRCFWPSAFCFHVSLQFDVNVSEERVAAIFRIEASPNIKTKDFVAKNKKCIIIQLGNLMA